MVWEVNSFNRLNAAFKPSTRLTLSLMLLPSTECRSFSHGYCMWALSSIRMNPLNFNEKCAS